MSNDFSITTDEGELEKRLDIIENKQSTATILSVVAIVVSVVAIIIHFI